CPVVAERAGRGERDGPARPRADPLHLRYRHPLQRCLCDGYLRGRSTGTDCGYTGLQRRHEASAAHTRDRCIGVRPDAAARPKLFLRPDSDRNGRRRDRREDLRSYGAQLGRRRMAFAGDGADRQEPNEQRAHFTQDPSGALLGPLVCPALHEVVITSAIDRVVRVHASFTRLRATARCRCKRLRFRGSRCRAPMSLSTPFRRCDRYGSAMRSPVRILRLAATPEANMEWWTGQKRVSVENLILPGKPNSDSGDAPGRRRRNPNTLLGLSSTRHMSSPFLSTSVT